MIGNLRRDGRGEEATEGAGAASTARPALATWTAYAAGAWALAFAVPHFYWAAGGCVGVPGDVCEAGLPTWFLVYDLVAGVLCVAGALVALALVRSWGRIVVRRRLAWIGGAVLVLRGGVGIVQDGLVLAGVVGSERGWEPTMLYDPWFLLGGVLFGAAAWFDGRGASDRGVGVR